MQVQQELILTPPFGVYKINNIQTKYSASLYGY